MKRQHSYALGGLAALVAAGAAYVTGESVVLAALCGAVWGTVATLLGTVRREFPEYYAGDGWEDGRWTGLAVGLTTAAALLGVQQLPSLPADLGFAIGLLVLGVGGVGYAAGTLATATKAGGVTAAGEGATGTANGEATEKADRG